MSTPQPTPETDAAIKESGGQWSFVLKETCEKLESERDEARKQLEAMERAGAEQARRADENREWALKAESERDEAREQLEAMRKAIKNAAYQLRHLAREIDTGWDVRAGARQALDKLQTFIKSV